MAKVYHSVLGVLLLCVGCHCSVPAPGVSAPLDTLSAPVQVEQNSNLFNYVEEEPVLAQVERVQESRKNIPQKTAKNIPASITDVYLSQLGVHEATGKNDGKDVEKYLRSVGLGKGYPWCAAFVKWCYDSAGIKTPMNGAAASAHNSKDLVWFHKTQRKEPEPGDAFTLWYNALGRIGHTGFFHKKVNATVYESVEGNTNEAGSREGDGVYRKYRSFNATYSISRWIK